MTKLTDRQVEAIAEACHENNRVWCEAHGDHSQSAWLSAPEWQKTSARNGVLFALESNRTPEESHVNWLAEKCREGWSYGPVKDVEKKQHPCYVPYDQLPRLQHAKDSLFLHTVHEFAELFAWQEK